MQVFRGFEKTQVPGATSVAIGNFDGVHLGHRELIRRARSYADNQGIPCLVYTFDPHPSQVLAPDKAPPLLMTTPRKLEVFDNLGVDICVLEPFNESFSKIGAEEFCKRVLADSLQAAHVVVGHDFCFGRNREGTADKLAAWGKDHGFSADIVEPVKHQDTRVSSTAIRMSLQCGDLSQANTWLGQPYAVSGVVVKGAQRGRTLGFPTANVDTAGLLPAPGIYAVTVDDQTSGRNVIRGVASLGTNPTFQDSGALSLEVFLFDFDGDIYGHELTVAFWHFLRGEEKFSNVDELIEQMHKDTDQAKAFLTENLENRGSYE